MKLSDIYTNIHTILSKDGNEGLITLDRWNTLLLSTLYEFIRNEAKINNVILENGNESMLSLRVLKNLSTWQENISISSPSSPNTGGSKLSLIYTGSSGLLQYDLLYWGVMWTRAVLVGGYSSENAVKRKIELISYDEFIRRYSNIMNIDIDENPVAYIINQTIDMAAIYPTSIKTIDFLYIRKPNTPFLDYYFDSNYKTVFMDEDTSHTLTTGEEYRDGTTTGAKTSQTQELEIPEDMYPEFQNYMIQKGSLMLGDQYTNQVAMAKQQMNESR
jgi:hypothetical protein